MTGVATPQLDADREREIVVLMAAGAYRVDVVNGALGAPVELDALHGVRKYDGRPFRPIEIIESVRRIAEVEAAEVL